MRYVIALMVSLGVLSQPALLSAQQRADGLAAVSPFVNEQTLVVVSIDLTRLDIPALQKQLFDPMVRTDGDRIAVSVFIDKLRLLSDQLRASGGGQVYLLASLSPAPDIHVSSSNFGAAPPTVFAVVPGAKGAALLTIDQLLKSLAERVTGRATPGQWDSCRQIGGVTVVASRTVLDQIRPGTDAPRPEFEQALAAGGDRPVRVAVVPPAVFSRAAAEMLREPAPGSDKPLGPILSRGVRWIGAGIDPNLQKFNANLVVQSVSADAANAFADTMKLGLATALLANPPAKDAVTSALISSQIFSLLPEPKGDRLVLSLEGQRAADFGRFAEMAWKASMASSWRNTSSNNLKQIGLAMMNYEDKKKQLPDRAIRDTNGKPLLSWRVAVLPEIEEGALYKEFHLDEPWDSEHNRKLIERMPEGLKNPDTWHLHPGRTRYLAAVGENLAFPPDRGIPLREFTDGASKTIMVVEADPEHAVIWTKPEDIEIDPANPTRGIAIGDQIFFAVFGDCHVEGISAAVNPQVLWAMFTRNAGDAAKSN